MDINILLINKEVNIIVSDYLVGLGNKLKIVFKDRAKKVVEKEFLLDDWLITFRLLNFQKIENCEYSITDTFNNEIQKGVFTLTYYGCISPMTHFMLHYARIRIAPSSYYRNDGDTSLIDNEYYERIINKEHLSDEFKETLKEFSLKYKDYNMKLLRNYNSKLTSLKGTKLSNDKIKIIINMPEFDTRIFAFFDNKIFEFTIICSKVINEKYLSNLSNVKVIINETLIKELVLTYLKNAKYCPDQFQNFKNMIIISSFKLGYFFSEYDMDKNVILRRKIKEPKKYNNELIKLIKKFK